MAGRKDELKVGVLIVAYNAESTLTQVLNRLPPTFCERVTRILVCDDASKDSTYQVGLGYQSQTALPLTVMRHPVNLGYGGNQKSGYRWAIEHGLDVVVLLHGDGQYAPEAIENLIAPFDDPDVDAVFGSRMMVPGEARRGGMALYKYLGNRILTTFENKMAGMRLTEWHSGYRAYRVSALDDIPFDHNSDGFDFDTQIILQLHEANRTIVEVPIATYYGDEICYVNGVKYARDVAAHVTRYRMHKVGFGTGDSAFSDSSYEIKMSPESSHGRLLNLMSVMPPSNVLDVGCADGRLGEFLRVRGHTVTGVDVVKHDGVADRLDAFVEADLDDALPAEVGGGYDVVVAFDVLEHTVHPDRVLRDLRERLAPGGVILACIPNFGHWYPRTRVLLGRFDYDRRGILDSTHVRFFTRRSFERVAERCGTRVAARYDVGTPIEVAERGGGQLPALANIPRKADDALRSMWPTLFAYQFLFELRPS